MSLFISSLIYSPFSHQRPAGNLPGMIPVELFCTGNKEQNPIYSAMTATCFGTLSFSYFVHTGTDEPAAKSPAWLRSLKRVKEYPRMLVVGYQRNTC